jgi:hypothetical protein
MQIVDVKEPKAPQVDWEIKCAAIYCVQVAFPKGLGT